MSRNEVITIGNILLLGEGNFTFASALLNVLNSDRNIIYQKITSTSYDSRNELEQKYQDIKSILKKICSYDRVLIMHNIDASKSLSDQLSSVENDSNDSIEARDFTYDHIIFNFPHLGIEDAMRHSCLLAHFLDSVKSIINESSIVYITLTKRQCDRWKLNEMSTRNNFIVSQEVSFIAAAWPNYESKRHHRGQSFRTRIFADDECVTYCLRLNNQHTTERNQSLAKSNDNNKNNIFELANFRYQQSLLHVISNTEIQLECSTITTTLTKNKKRKATIENATDGQYATLLINSAPVYECLHCKKQFPLLQGIRGHIYSQHVLPLQNNKHITNNNNNNVSANITTTFTRNNNDNDIALINNPSTAAITIIKSCHQCSVCEKSFNTNDALKQHTNAKHSGILTPAPDWSAVSVMSRVTVATDNNHFIRTHTNINTNGDITTSCPITNNNIDNKNNNNNNYDDYNGQGIDDALTCHICGLSFQSITALSEHKTSLIPLSLQLEQLCKICGESFQDSRALIQHQKSVHLGILILQQSNVTNY